MMTLLITTLMIVVTVIMPRSLARREMLSDLRRRKIAGRKPEHFAPNLNALRALARRGLVSARHVGQRWWTIRLTDAGRRCA